MFFDFSPKVLCFEVPSANSNVVELFLDDFQVSF